MNFSPGKLGDCFEHSGIQGMFLEVPGFQGVLFTMTLDFQGSLYKLPPRFPGWVESRYPGNYV